MTRPGEDTDRLWVTCGTKDVLIEDGINPVWFQSVIVYELWIGQIPPVYSPSGSFVAIDNSRCRYIKEIGCPEDIEIKKGQRAEMVLRLQWDPPVSCKL